METYKLRSKEKVSELMETYIAENGAEPVSWLNYIKFARFFDDVKLVRTLCKRGLEYCQDFDTLSGAWLEWEKKFGTIDSLQECESKIKKKALRIRQEQPQPVEEPMPQRRPSDQGGYTSKRRRPEGEEEGKKSRPPPLAARNTLFIRNLPTEVLEDELEQFFANSVHFRLRNRI